MLKINLDLLKYEDVYKLDILAKSGYTCSATNFARILGAKVSPNKTREGEFLEGTYLEHDPWDEYYETEWETKSSVVDKRGIKPYLIRIISPAYDENSKYFFERINLRPVVAYSDIADQVRNEKINVLGINEVEFGEYPQRGTSNLGEMMLTRELNAGNLVSSGKTYTVDETYGKAYNISVTEKKLNEYYYNGERYVRYVVEDPRNSADAFYKLKKGSIHFFKVMPIKWLVDKEKNIAIAKNVFFCGCKFAPYKMNYHDMLSYPNECGGYQRYYDGDFDKSVINQFMNEHIANDIIVSDSQVRKSLDVSADFIDLCQKAFVLPEDVLSGNSAKYEQIDIPGIQSAIAKQLAAVDDEYFDVTKKFVTGFGEKLKCPFDFMVKEERIRRKSKQF